VAHTCNPSYLGSGDREDRLGKPACANNSQDPVLKLAQKRDRVVTQEVEHLPSQREPEEASKVCNWLTKNKKSCA
jgi:hypothetical protein